MSQMRKRSKVWDSFNVDGDKACCKLCRTVVRHSGGTSNLINHLRIHEVKKELKTEEIIETSENVEEMPQNIEELVEVYETDESGMKFEVFDNNPSDLPVETVNVETACRICLCDVKSILHFGIDEVARSCNNLTYAEIFTEFSGYDIISQEPQYFCAKCTKKLVSFYELKQRCNETQEILEEWIKNEQEMLQAEDVLAVSEEKIEETPTESNIDYIIEEVEDEDQLFNEPQSVDVEYEQVENLNEASKNSIFRVPDNVQVLEECHDCEICNISYRTRRALRVHYRQTHPELRNIDCPHCEIQQFPIFLEDHVARCKKANVPSPCEICGVVIKRVNMTRHRIACRISSRHPAEKPFQCDICGVRTVAKYGLVKHMQIQHLNRRLRCKICFAEFKTPSVYSAHLRKYHPEKKPPLRCKICDFQTTEASVLRRHHLYHTGEKRHKCETCGREFRAKDVLRDHMTTHSDERPFPCETCQSRFKTRKALGVHMKTHRAHEYECPKCKRTYLTNQQMRIHVKRVHPDYELPPKGTIFNKNWRIKKAREEIKEMAVKEGFDASVVDNIMIEEPPSIDQKIYIRTNYSTVGLIEEL
ncbi:zinc finger protein 62 homolog [Culicoides brevitarsis]|uniref:zinc finger protein 62 homolog n=1 Tax=Culicoides brevitarsis TaxID=469753 RepID=UPI00307C6F4A